MSHHKVKNLILKISNELYITTEFVDDAPERYTDFLDINCSWSIGNNRIIVGKYLNGENMLISFFHEIGHQLISKEYINRWKYNTLIIELKCWDIGLEEARNRGILFSDNAIKFGFEKALTYCGHDERECVNWKDAYGNNLIINHLTN